MPREGRQEIELRGRERQFGAVRSDELVGMKIKQQVAKSYLRSRLDPRFGWSGDLGGLRAFLELAHDRADEVFDRSIDIRIARICRKVEQDPANPRMIKTVRGAGYIFVPAKP